MKENFINENNELIWYLCYGSNLCEERLMAYITGSGCKKFNLDPDYNPCANIQKPIQNIKFTIPYKIYFAKSSRNWSYGGVAFLNPKLNSGLAYCRAYLITKEQFDFIYRKENGGNIQSGWYHKIIELGKIEGYNAYTFTNSKVFESKNRPTELYVKCIKEGLREAGYAEIEIDLYIEQILK